MSDSSDKAEATNVDALRRMQTAESVLLPIPKDTFEKLYLSPKHPSKSQRLTQKFGNPTPISLIGFLLASTPNSMIFMGWRGAGGHGAAIIPVYIWFGGMVQIFGAVGEWILGNTFTCAIFFTYGTFWIVHGTGLMPFFATGIQYSEDGSWMKGLSTPGYEASMGFYFVALAILTAVFLVCSIRTNFCLFSALFLLVITFGLFSGAYFNLAIGETVLAGKLQVAAGAFNFALCIPVWIIFIAQILEAVDFPVSIPVGDFSSIVPGRSQRMRERDSEA